MPDFWTVAILVTSTIAVVSAIISVIYSCKASRECAKIEIGPVDKNDLREKLKKDILDLNSKK